MIKMTQKFVSVINILLGIISFLIAIAFFTSENRLGFIFGFLLFLIAGGQLYLLKSTVLKVQIITSVISIIIFLVIMGIAFRLNI